MRRRVSASSAAKGSSISSTWGCMASARAMATRCFMPPDSWCGCTSANRARPTLSRYSAARSAASARVARREASSGNITFSRTVFQGGSWSNSWNTTTRSGPGAVTARPCRRTVPSAGAMNPAMDLSSVDLPQPDAPSST